MKSGGLDAAVAPARKLLYAYRKAWEEVNVFKHPHAKATHPTIEWESGNLTSIYVIETDLVLSKADPAFDETAFNELVEAATGYLQENPDYERIVFRPYQPR